MDFVTIDFEASCLPRHGRSYPIEVALSGREGTKSWLIRPHPLWRQWDWTLEAADLHGISRDMLARDGRAPRLVLTELRAAIAGRRVFADSDVDRYWWETLAAGAAVAAVCPIENANRYLDELGASTEQVTAARNLADSRCDDRHRAGPDAEWLYALLSQLGRAPAQHANVRQAA